MASADRWLCHQERAGEGLKIDSHHVYCNAGYCAFVRHSCRKGANSNMPHLAGTRVKGWSMTKLTAAVVYLP